MIFGKICYVACVISHAGKLICLHACLHECDHAGLIGKPDLVGFQRAKAQKGVAFQCL